MDMRNLANNSRPKQSTGFTLIELLVVIAIVSMLVTLLVPTVMRARSIGRQGVCTTNVREIARACVLYARDDSMNRMPGAGTFNAPTNPHAFPSIGANATWGDLKTGGLGAMWLLLTGHAPDTTANVKNSWTTPDRFVCAEMAASLNGRAPSINDTQFYISAPSDGMNTCAYGYVSQVAFDRSTASGAVHFTGISLEGSYRDGGVVPTSLVIVADRNPHVIPNGTNSAFTWDSTQDSNTTLNSANHAGRGENIARIDGSAEWITNPILTDKVMDATALPANYYYDNIYYPRGNTASSAWPGGTNSIPTASFSSGKKDWVNDTFILP